MYPKEKGDMFGIGGNPSATPCLCLPFRSRTTQSPPSVGAGVFLRPPSKKQLQLVRSSSSEVEDRSSSSKTKTEEENKNVFAVAALVVDIPKTIWRQTLRPLSDFGFGKKSIWEGGVGLFLVSGALLSALTLLWLRGFYFRSRFRKYQAVFEFSQASGMCTGTPVRIRGVTVGNVIRILPSLKNIQALVEIEDEKVIIPRNSLIEVNQSGLLMETMIDITPRDPLPTPSVGPLDTDCIREGLIVCDRQRIRGHQGISLDALVGIFTRLGREMEEIGVARGYKLAEQVASVIQEAKPLIAMIEAMAEDVQPLLADVRDSGLLKEVESLTKSLTEVTADLRTLNSSIMSPENTEQIRRSIYSFVFTLKNIENISSDLSSFTGDENTRRNLKLLIKSLSRLL